MRLFLLALLLRFNKKLFYQFFTTVISQRVNVRPKKMLTTTAIGLQSTFNTQQGVWLFVFLVCHHLQK